MGFCWLGTTPTMIIMDPELVKEVLSNKLGHIQKPPLNPLILILTRGLTTLQGEKWATDRRIINPAFHLDRLKVCFFSQLAIHIYVYMYKQTYSKCNDSSVVGKLIYVRCVATIGAGRQHTKGSYIPIACVRCNWSF